MRSLGGLVLATAGQIPTLTPTPTDTKAVKLTAPVSRTREYVRTFIALGKRYKIYKIYGNFWVQV